MLSKDEIVKVFRNRIVLECKRLRGRQEEHSSRDCLHSLNCQEHGSFCEDVVLKSVKYFHSGILKGAGILENIERFRFSIEEQYKRNPTGCGGSFGEILCYEIHETELTFKDLARVWGIDLEFLGDIVRDHCIKLKPIEGVE